MTALSLIFTLAAIGISETAYLIRERMNHRNPVCVIGGKCLVVLQSKYNRIFLIPNEYLGMAFYLGLAFLASLLVIGVGPLELWERAVEVMLALGVLFFLFFLFLQWKVIKAWCFWCVMAATTTFLMAIIVFFADLA